MDEKTASLPERLIMFMGDRFEADMEDFFADHCEIFEREDETEHKLEYTKIHKKYEILVEGHLEGTSSSPSSRSSAIDLVLCMSYER